MADYMTVLITGATSGFGEATARLLAKHGHRVVITGRRRDRLDRLAGELDGQAHAIVLDVRDEAAVMAAVAGLPREFAALDVLINNAGLALGLEPAHEANMSDWDTMVDTNIKGLMYCTRAVLPGMVSRGRGHIVNLGSIAGTYPYPGGNVYGATKAFVHQFSLNLRADLLGKNVRVTSIEPGLAETEFSVIRFKGDKDKAKTPYRGVQAMTADDIAAAIYFAITLPPHVNVNVIEMMATNQAFAPFAIHRE
jgi:3-hydroxy acid dehydrogenase / malonic semialdehyde reductase